MEILLRRLKAEDCRLLVRIDDVPPEELPEDFARFLDNVLGFPFIYKHEQRRLVLRMKHDHEEFDLEFETLRKQLADRLTGMKSDASSEESADSQKQPTVLIATTTPDLRRAFKALKSHCESAGLRALPAGNYSSSLEKFREEQCGGCRHFGQRRIRHQRAHNGQVYSVAFSPDGSQIVSGSDDESARVWDVDSGRRLFILKGHEDFVTSVACSPDGTRIVSGSEDSTLRVWDAETGQETLTLQGRESTIHSVAFSPDRMWIVSGTFENTIKVWTNWRAHELPDGSGLYVEP